MIEKAESSLGIPSPTEVSAETRLSEGDKGDHLKMAFQIMKR